MKPSSTCLVTGSSGFLGSAIAAALVDSFRVAGLGHSGGAAGVERIDLRDSASLRGLLGRIAPEVVVHCAAYRDPDFCEEHPDEARRLNVEPVRVMCETLPAAARLLFISSDYVFDGEHAPYAEHSPRRPVNVYGLTKMEAEDAVLAREGAIILRVPVLVGAGPTLAESGFIAQMLEAVRSSAPALIDDTVVRYPTWIRDVAAAVRHLLGIGASGVFHFTGRRGATRFGWTVEMARILGASSKHLKPVLGDTSRRARRPRDAHLSMGRISATGFDLNSDFADVIRSTLRGFGVTVSPD